MNTLVRRDLYKYKGPVDHGFALRKIRRKLMACFCSIQEKHERIQNKARAEIEVILGTLDEVNLLEHAKKYADFINV